MGHTRERAGLDDPSVRLGLRVSPGAERSEIVGRHGEVWKVRVAARRERGRANDALIDLIAETLRVARRSVTIVAGGGSRDKVIEVKGISVGEAERLLAAGQRKGNE